MTAGCFRTIEHLLFAPWFYCICACVLGTTISAWIHDELEVLYGTGLN